MLCPECGKVLTKNPKDGQGSWECRSELGCQSDWFILKISKPKVFRKRGKK